MNNTLIVLIFFVTLVILDFTIKVYFTKKQQNTNQNNTKDENEKLLTDFLSLISGICKECLDILEAEKTMSHDDFEDLLAKKVLDTFKSTIGEYYKNTYIIELINNLPDEFIIKWIKDNVFTLDEFAEKIKNKLKDKQPEQTNILKEITDANK